MAVKEKWLQGGGLGPVVGGEDHLSEEGEITRLFSEAEMATKKCVCVCVCVWGGGGGGEGGGSCSKC